MGGIIIITDLDAREYEVLKGNELYTFTKTHKKTLRPILDGEFKFVQLDDNLSRSVKIDTSLLARVKKDFIEYVRSNIDLFAISPHKMLGIYSKMTCH